MTDAERAVWRQQHAGNPYLAGLRKGGVLEHDVRFMEVCMNHNDPPDYRADPSPWDVPIALFGIGCVLAVWMLALGLPIALAWAIIKGVWP